ncbi:hypothetical protein FS837_006302 [Tulasnella sp. UAMH 9824]|nr:hypothetical protein FS837_006302 [Tulasnella sp. UAMH 9824]
MRFSFIVLSAASLVSASSLFKRNDDYEVPWCAKDCISKGDPSPCKPDDVACLCVNPNYYNPIYQCVQDACSPDDAKKAAEIAIKYCEGAGIDPENPVPKCGLECSEKTPTEGCDKDDLKCLCENKDYLEKVVWCFKDGCKGQDFETTKCASEAYCRTVGVDISYIFGY